MFSSRRIAVFLIDSPLFNDTELAAIRKTPLLKIPAIAAMHGPHSLIRLGDYVRNKLNYRFGN